MNGTFLMVQTPQPMLDVAAGTCKACLNWSGNTRILHKAGEPWTAIWNGMSSSLPEAHCQNRIETQEKY